MLVETRLLYGGLNHITFLLLCRSLFLPAARSKGIIIAENENKDKNQNVLCVDGIVVLVD